MSEYQFYEFLAVDRPLDVRQQAELRALSTRADITATSFVNEYHWGDFRGDPRRLMERYFDAFLYITNWGTHQLMLRLPERLLDLETAQQYCCTDNAGARQHGDHLILDLCFTTEEGLDWDHTDETRLGALTPIRADLAAGDHRALYLGWLLAAQTELDDDGPEPPVPPGMAELTGPLRTLADFLRIDEDLLAAAAAASEPAAAGPATAELASWIAELPATEKDALLSRVVDGDPHVGAELRRRIRTQQDITAPRAGTRTVGDLLATAAARRTTREQQQAWHAAEQRARRERAAALAHQRRLDELSTRVEQAWHQVNDLINTKRPADYDAAVALLTDLKAVHERNATPETFAHRYQRLRTDHQRKPSLIARLNQAQL